MNKTTLWLGMEKENKNIWYGVDPGAWKLDLSDEKSINAYFLKEEDAKNYYKLWAGFAEINEVDKPSHLEFKVSEGEDIVASFRFEGHAEKYKNGEFEKKRSTENNFKKGSKEFSPYDLNQVGGFRKRK